MSTRQDMPWVPPPEPPAQQPYQATPQRRRWPIIVAVIVVVLLGFSVLADRLSVAFAQSTIAGVVKDNGFGVEPDVKIYGFPFLTQLATLDFQHGRMTAKNVKQGPLNISLVDVDVRNVSTSLSFSSGTLGSLDGKAVVTFGDLTGAAGQPGLSMTAAGPDTVKIKLDLAITSGSATAKVTKEGNGIRVRATDVQGFDLGGLGDQLGGLLGNNGNIDFTVPVSGLPLGMKFETLKVTTGGVEMHVTGKNVKFG